MSDQPPAQPDLSVPDLSVIVPVYEAAAHLPDLVDDLRAIAGIRTEIILVDDASPDHSAQIIRDLAAQFDNVTGLFHRQNSGAGRARDTGFARATGRYALFFDADDKLHGSPIAPAIARMDAAQIDMAMFSYRYERSSGARRAEVNPNDQLIWTKLLSGRPEATGTAAEFAALLGYTNYPWNKILRRGTYAAAGLRFGSTIVNNDILGHWYALLFAQKILLVDQVLCTHIVTAAGGNLTNQHSRVRLQLFTALHETYDLLEAHPALRRRFATEYWAFVHRLCDWARNRVVPELWPEFDRQHAALISRIDLGDFRHLMEHGSRGLGIDLMKTLRG